MLSKEETERYSRQIMLPEIGLEGQQRMKDAKVLVIGVGGLGCPVLQYLAAAGVGTIGIVDDDIVSVSNLQRQILYTSDDIGKPKAVTAAGKIALLNPSIKAVIHHVRLNETNAAEIIGQYDIIVDGSDNFPTRYLVNDACVELDKPLVFGSVLKFEGQVAVLNYNNGPTYRCIFPDAPEDSPNCGEIGVIGVLPGIVGMLQANEVIKIITGAGEVLSGKLLIIDALTMRFSFFDFKRTCNETSAGTKEYAVPCAAHPGHAKAIKELSAKQLKDQLEREEDIFILDVREPYEYEQGNIGGELIPLSELPGNVDRIPFERNVVVVCYQGARSTMAIRYLQENYGFVNLYNLSGGIQALEKVNGR